MTRAKVWEKRKPLLSAALKRLRPTQWRGLLRLCHRADLAIKGQCADDAWHLLADISAGLSGKLPPTVPQAISSVNMRS